MIEVPLNYFGRGRDYILPDNLIVIQEFDKKFKEWEAAHPDDPTGELALISWEAEQASNPEVVQKPIIKKVAAAKPKIVEVHYVHPPTEPAPEKEEENDDFLEGSKLRLELPQIYIKKLKAYARLKRRRPRDIVSFWINQYCKLE